MTDEDLKRLFDAMREENTAAHAETRRQVEETLRQVGETRQQVEETRRELGETRREAGETRQQVEETRRELGETRREAGETRQQVEETRRELGETRREAGEMARQNRQHFDITAEAFKDQVQLIAEKIVGVSEELRREAADIRLEMRTGFAETQAMIKFSHAELDRRVRALEEKERSVDETLADIQARLERLEASTH